jgi:fucose 4-O-acetylase-like acetyltransferase
LLLPVSGLLGAVCWHLVSFWVFSVEKGTVVESSAVESFVFGLCYAAGLTTAIAGLTTYTRPQLRRRSDWVVYASMVFLGGVAALSGFWLPYAHPTLSNQRDIDLFVGIILRLGLALIAGMGVPPLHAPEFRKASMVKWIPWQDAL